jgi:sugar/nucleoside kinase (ribokinase family)
MRRFKIAVIGTINKDTIIFPDGRRTESFGGILYNVSALSGLGREDLEIYPVCNVGYDVHDRVTEILEGYGNVKQDGVRKVRRKNNHARLLIDEEGQRHEVLKNRVPILTFSRVEPFLDSDGILVNFISGFDISLSTLKRIRRETSSLIFMDIHSLALGIKRDGRRFFRTPKNWRGYIKQTDLVQANLAEWGVLAGKDLTSSTDLRYFGSYILSLSPEALLLTMGRGGAVMVYRHGKSCRVGNARGIRVREFKDATGAGDAFSAGFLVCYLKTKNLARSLDFANRVAAATCKTSGVEEVAGLVGRHTHQTA